jgi:hypothetical protein
VEASLLPSRAIAALSEEVVLVVLRSTRSQCAGLCKEFAVPCSNSWVVVLDAKGETLASWIGDAAGDSCEAAAAQQFAEGMAARIRDSLRYPVSLQELERQWRRDYHNLAQFEKYTARLKEMEAFGKLRRLYLRLAADSRFDEKQRQDFRLRAWFTLAEEPFGLDTTRQRTRFARQGEQLLVDVAAQPCSTVLVETLFRSVYTHGFDVPARMARARERLKELALRLGKPAALEKHIRQLARLCRDWARQMQERLDQETDPTNAQFVAASLGDAQAAVDLFSQPDYREVPEYQERLRAAEKKLRHRKEFPEL